MKTIKTFLENPESSGKYGAAIESVKLGEMIDDLNDNFAECNARDEAVEERVDEIEGNIEVKVQPSGGTFYRYGVLTTNNWCSKFVSKDIAGIVVETADEARKFNLKNPATSGICIASGAGQRWNIVAPNGYRIKTYKIVATLRDGQPEGVVFLTPQGGDSYQIIPNSDITIEVSVNAASTFFETEDISTQPLDRQVWFKTFEIYVERTSSLATMDDVNRKQDIISDLTNIRNGAAKGTTALQPTAQTLSDAQKAQARENIGAEQNTRIVSVQQGATALACEIGKYYKVHSPADTFSITLPGSPDTNIVQSIVIFLVMGSNTVVTISSSAVDVFFQYGFELKQGRAYEINAIHNGGAWVIAATEIVY